MTASRVIDGVTGTQRLYVQVMNQEAKNWKVSCPVWTEATAKAAYLSYAGAMFRLFDKYSRNANGFGLSELLGVLHEAETVAQYKAMWALAKFGTADCPAKRFVLGLGIEKYAGLAAGQADTFKQHGPGQVINLMQCNGLASWTGLKMLVPPAEWSKRKAEFKAAFLQALAGKI
jgi:hypothetical protein